MGKENYYYDLEEQFFEDTILQAEEGLNLVTFNDDAFAMNVLYDEVIREIATEMHHICCFYRIDYRYAATLSYDLGINKIPIILFYQSGEYVDHLKGIYSKNYIRNYIHNLANH